MSVMSSLLKRYKDRRLRREQLSLQRWPEIRAKGRGQYVLRQAFSFAVFATALFDVVNQIFHFGASSLWEHIAQYAFTGVFIGYLTWSDQEAKYKKAQLKSSTQTSVQTH